MKVTINGTTYDANETKIEVELNDLDKENIKNMNPDATKYVCIPEPKEKPKNPILRKVNVLGEIEEEIELDGRYFLTVGGVEYYITNSDITKHRE